MLLKAEQRLKKEKTIVMAMKQTRNVLLGVLLLGTSACGFDGAIRTQFHQPSVSGEKLPLRVAVLDDGGLHPPAVVGGMWGEHEVTIDHGFAHAITTELTALFQDVKVIKNPQQALPADMMITVTSTFRSQGKDPGATMALALRPPWWNTDLAQYESSAKVSYICSCSWAPALIGLSLLILTPVVIPSASLTELNDTVDGLEQGITAMLKDISAQVRSDQRILAFTEQKKFWPTAVAAGEQAERTGDRLKGLELYMRAWRGRPRPELEQQLQGKIAKLVSDLKTLPPISEEVRRYGVQATSQVEKKRYDEAIKLYDKALDIAPWWAEGHFNRALVLATQSRYPEAVASMKAFLVLSPQSPDARAAQDKIYEWELQAK